MSKMLWNPTNEDLNYQYSGITYFFAPGEKKKIENENCAKHLLHNLDARGLTVLEFGDTEEDIGKAALARNKAFKQRMVSEFNQRNEIRKQTGLSFLPPTDQLQAYAIELGMGLLEHFTVKDAEREAAAKEREESERLRDENRMLKTNLSDLAAQSKAQGEQIAELIKLMVPQGGAGHGIPQGGRQKGA